MHAKAKLDSWPLKMGPIDRPEISLRNLHYSLCNSPEECNSRLLREREAWNRVITNKVCDKDIMITTKQLLIQRTLLILLLLLLLMMMMMALALFHTEGYTCDKYNSSQYCFFLYGFSWNSVRSSRRSKRSLPLTYRLSFLTGLPTWRYSKILGSEWKRV
jgi:hypothetical protein